LGPNLSLTASASRALAFSMGGARSMVSEVEASPLFGTSTVFSIEDPASLDFGCSEIKRRNSSMLQSIETKFAIFFSKLMFFALGHDTDRKAGRNTPSKRALRPAAIARDGLILIRAAAANVRSIR